MPVEQGSLRIAVPSARALAALLAGTVSGGFGGGVARAELSATAPPAWLGSSQGCDDLELAPLAAALAKEHATFGQRSGPLLRFGSRSVTPAIYAARTLLPLVQLAGAGDRAALCAALRTRFDYFRAAPSGATHFTGYHTPSVRGSLSRGGEYQFPLYRRPPGAMARYSTEQILAGALKGRGLELVWLADAYDALALHIEGSGNVLLPDGRTFAVGTEGHNGLPYTNVSKLLIADGKLPPGPPPPATRPGNPKARRYFAEHPDAFAVYWGKNAHFVFFRPSSGPAGRLGALTAGRSVAIDPAEIPLGAVLLVHAQKPIVDGGARVTGWQPYSRLVLGQDTGAGIRGPRRIDVYFGDDDYAQVAGGTATVDGDAVVLLAR